MPRLLLSPPGSQGVALFESLLLSLLKFLEPYLRTSALMTDGMKTLYKVCYTFVSCPASLTSLLAGILEAHVGALA